MSDFADTSKADQRLIAYNRVPLASGAFWLAELLVVSVGETVVEYLKVQLALGLPAILLIMLMVLVVAFTWQFSRKRYVPVSYWLAIGATCVVSMLVADGVVASFHVSLAAMVAVLLALLAATFFAWNAIEGIPTIRHVTTGRREAFYWLVVFFTFALSAGVDDLMPEQFSLVSLDTGILSGLIVLSLALGYYFFGLDETLAFWLVFILIQPLGDALGDLSALPRQYGGLGLGSTTTGLIFLAIIVAVVIYMTLRHDGAETTRADEIEPS